MSFSLINNVNFFLIGMNMLSGMNWKDSFDDMKRKFWPVYKVSIIIIVTSLNIYRIHIID